IFWFVHDAQKAALNITNYREAIDRVAQTSLREMIGSSMLSALLSERTAADELLRSEIGRKTADWGISVKSVEIRDVAIPVALQDAMSRQAQADGEKQARVILGSAEAAIAGKFVEAAMIYAGQPAALQLHPARPRRASAGRPGCRGPSDRSSTGPPPIHRFISATMECISSPPPHSIFHGLRC